MSNLTGRERSFRILVVDDEEQIRKLLTLGLTRAGFHVAVAGDGTEALSTIRDHGVPDLVITDVSMPLMNGFELAGRLRSARRTAAVPIIMLSAFSQPDNIVKGYAQGADDYLAKPVEMPVLVAKIESLLRRAPRAVSVEDAPGSIVAFAHAKGGAGTTTLAVNTAVLLASRGERVAVFDASVEFPGVGIMLDLRPPGSLADLAGLHPPVDREIFESMCATHSSGLALLQACDATERSELVTVPAIQEAVAYLATLADWVIVDCPASLNERTLAVLDAANVICLVTSVTAPAIHATQSCLRVFDMIGYAGKTSVVLNRTSGGGLSLEQAGRYFPGPATFGVTYSELFDDAANSGRPVVAAQSAAGSAAYQDVEALVEVLRRATVVAAPA